MLFKFLWSGLLDLLLPRHCLGCQFGGTYLCANCAGNLMPAIDLGLEKTQVLGSYEDERLKKLIWKLKYNGQRAIAEALGPLLYAVVAETIAEEQSYHPGEALTWLVLPLPLSRKRRRERGYNQAELLARALTACDPDHLELNPKVLQKIRHTPTQVSIKSRQARLKNLRGAFAVTDPEQVSGRRIILVDDVITTGGTVTAAREVLTQAGARTVYAVAIAHG